MVTVKSEPAADGWVCQVRVEHGGERSEHTVKVSRADLERWGGGRDADELVRRSFEFLLEREPATSILRRFDLSVIPAYFPDYDRQIRR